MSRLCEHEADHSAGFARIVLDGVEKCGAVGDERRAALPGPGAHDIAKSGQRLFHIAEELTHVVPGARIAVGASALRRVREQELVTGLNGLDSGLEILFGTGIQFCAHLTCQRSGS